MKRTPQESLAEAIAHLDAMHRHLARGAIDDETVADAVSLRLAATIETLHRGAPDLTTGLFGDEWSVIWGMRNRIAHGYAWIDIETVRATVDEDLPSVEATLRSLLQQIRDTAREP
ncbi:HepT-like ribonuclease domain-containing protein [Microbacterium sp. Mu-80]|uniref:HepT-like ribonuclease domain-containing protein n=1 Tax=Microbacterium bandirmense TaxID=3122050 RepID=A0ABU8L9L2_9MICO